MRNGEINRELTALMRMFSLALQAGKSLRASYLRAAATKLDAAGTISGTIGSAAIKSVK